AIGAVTWAPDGKQYAFTQTTDTRVELWVQNAVTGDSFMHEEVALNTALGAAPVWMPDGRTILCQVVPQDRGKPPQPPRVPSGPTIQESDGKPAPVRTFQDLLQNSSDERLFDHYATSQILLYDTAKGKIRTVGAPAIFGGVTPSPDGKLLLVTR